MLVKNISDLSKAHQERIWDTAIVGGGAVGIYLAISLCKKGENVILLESGAEDFSRAASILNDVTMSGRFHSGAKDGRARILGGTTTLWGGQLTQFTSHDFRQRDSLGPQWQIKYDDIIQRYALVAKELGLDANRLDDTTLLSEEEQNLNSQKFDCEIFFTRWLKEQNFANSFSKDLRQTPNLLVALQAHVSSIESNTNRVTSLKVHSIESSIISIYAKKYVLACGTIEISRLLLLSKENGNKVPWSGNDNVGRYFQDHIDLDVARINSGSTKKLLALFENQLILNNKYQPKLRRKQSLLQNDDLNIACSFKFNSTLGDDISTLKKVVRAALNGRLSLADIKSLNRLFSLMHVLLPLIWRYIRHKRIMAIADGGIDIVAHCEQKPLRESRISLDHSRLDIFGKPLAKIDWQVEDESIMQALHNFTPSLRSFLEENFGTSVVINKKILSNDLSFIQSGRDSYHQCGGACMSDCPSTGVVDQDCKVFGTDNLYIAGAAVFPYSSFANPTFTALALASRISEKICAK